MGTITKPDIIRQTIVINDDYIRKNRRSDGKVRLTLGYADKKNNRIIVNKFVIDKNAKLLSQSDIADINRRINSVDEGDIIAHESQHLHNGAIGYHYLANADNIYECMMLSLADEMSAMIAGYLHKTKKLDDAIDMALNNMSKLLRQEYINGQFVAMFNALKKTWGEYKNLYEYKYDGKKIKRVTDFYFTFNGVCMFKPPVVVSKEIQVRFNTFFVEFKKEVSDFIDNQIAMSKISQKSM